MEPYTMLKTDPVDDKFFSRPLISKQHSSMINLVKSTSLRVAYTGNGGVSAGVPFLWESKPGTPKHLSSNSNTTSPSSTLFPPLNPPPRAYNRNVPQTPMRLTRRAKSSFALRNLFPVKFLRNKSRHSEDGHGDAVLAPESLSPSSSSSASSSVPSSPVIRPLAIFRRSHSTSISHNKSVFDYDLYDDKSTSASCGIVRCFGP